MRVLAIGVLGGGRCWPCRGASFLAEAVEPHDLGAALVARLVGLPARASAVGRGNARRAPGDLAALPASSWRVRRRRLALRRRGRLGFGVVGVLVRRFGRSSRTAGRTAPTDRRSALIASNGTTSRSGTPPNDRPTSKPSSVTFRSQNWCCRTIVISSGYCARSRSRQPHALGVRCRTR